MSFFKLAENLLNTLDQTTQSALHQKPSDELANRSSKSSTFDFDHQQQSQHLRTSSDAQSYLNTNKSSSKTSMSASMTLPTQADFSNGHIPLPSAVADSAPMSRTNSSSSFTTKKQTTKDEANLFLEYLNDDNKSEEGGKANSPSSKGSRSSSVSTHTGDERNKKARERDNSDNESNNEMVSMRQKIKQIEEENKQAKSKLSSVQSKLDQSNRIIKELRSREDDLNETVRSKDTQLAVLKIRVQECDDELKLNREEINNLKSNSTVQSNAYQAIKTKLDQLEIQMQGDKNISVDQQREYQLIQEKFEKEKRELTDRIVFLEKKMSDEKAKYGDVENQLSTIRSQNTTLRKEFDDYKSKASKTLLAKDRLIENLKEKSSWSTSAATPTDALDSNDPNASNSGNPFQMELHQLKQERDYLRDEVESKNASIDLLKAQLNDSEEQFIMETDELRNQLRECQSRIEEEMQSEKCLEQDMTNLKEQLSYAQEELHKQKYSLTSQIQERDNELNRLKNQLNLKSSTKTSEKELESRLHLLTENLIQKQTLIEALQSEKHSIFLQLERSQRYVQDLERSMLNKNNRVSLNMDSDYEYSNKFNYLHESPQDHEVTRKVKRAATEIDKFSIRLGVFLKKYPIARIFVIFYMFLLHLWVGIVLFTYKPEIHNTADIHQPHMSSNTK